MHESSRKILQCQASRSEYRRALDGRSSSSIVQRQQNTTNAGCRRPGQRTFPNANHAPAMGSQRPAYTRVASLVGGKLLPPQYRVSLRFEISTTIVAVPKAAVHEYGQL